MTTTLNAIFEHGAFRPETPVDIPDGAHVQIAVEYPFEPGGGRVVSESEKQSIVRRVVERMMRNPLPADAPRFARDEMYDRG